MQPKTLYVLTFVSALWGCATSSDFGSAAWRHNRDSFHFTQPRFPQEAERSPWVTRSGARGESRRTP